MENTVEIEGFIVPTKKQGMHTKVDKEVSDSSNKKRITTWIDHEVIEALKIQAAEKGTKYQSLLNEILRDSVLGEERNQWQEKIDDISQKVSDIHLVLKNAHSLEGLKHKVKEKKKNRY